MINKSNGGNKKEYSDLFVITYAILHNDQNQIMLIKKKSGPFKNHLYLPGGLVKYDEKIEDTIRREIKKTVSLIIEPLDILGVYSDFNRDSYKHVLSVVFICLVLDSLKDKVEKNQNLNEKHWTNLNEIDNHDFLYDHKMIIDDYLKWRHFNSTYWTSKIR